jgi:hypothetical protein
MKLLGKTQLFGAIALTVGLSSMAHADSILVVTKLDVAGKPVVMEQPVGFGPKTKVIVVEVAGKKCQFGTSLQGHSPKGCNYTITIDKSGVTPSARAVEGACMNTPMVCK